jgi:hypothetical protein
MTTVFVFGSNTEGRHGAGAALAAQTWGASYGQPEGRQGNTYAIPTVALGRGALSLAEIKTHVDTFLEYAREHPDTAFLVSAIGCGLAGYAYNHISPMFRGAPYNCTLPIGWRN